MVLNLALSQDIVVPNNKTRVVYSLTTVLLVQFFSTLKNKILPPSFCFYIIHIFIYKYTEGIDENIFN